MIELDYFKLIWLLSGMAVLVLGICLLVIAMPKNPKLKTYRVRKPHYSKLDH